MREEAPSTHNFFEKLEGKGAVSKNKATKILIISDKSQLSICDLTGYMQLLFSPAHLFDVLKK